MNRILRSLVALPILSLSIFVMACAHDMQRSEYKYESEMKGTAPAATEVTPAPVDRGVSSYYEHQERSTATVSPAPVDEGVSRSYYEHREASVTRGVPLGQDLDRSYYERREDDLPPSYYPPSDLSDSTRTRTYYEQRETKSLGF